MSGIPQGTLKIIQEYPIIIIFSVLGISSYISSIDLIIIFLSFELQGLAVIILAVFIMVLWIIFIIFGMILTSVIINLCYLRAIKIIREFYRVISFSACLLLFLLDEVIDPAMTAKALGHQWYWNSNYLDFLDEAIDPAMTTKALGLKLYWSYEFFDFLFKIQITIIGTSVILDTAEAPGSSSLAFSTSPNEGPCASPEGPPKEGLPQELTFNNLHDPETRKAAQKALAGKAGIYCIRCLKGGKCYVGSAVNLYDRMCDHLWQNGNVSNSHLQAAIALYGLENFEYFVIEFVIEKELLIKVEQKYLNMVPSNLRYNFSPTAGSCLGVVRSAETKATMSEAQKGEKNPIFGKSPSAETKAAISNALKGTTRSAETKAAISEALKGNTHRLGTTQSVETKAAIGAALSKAVYIYDSNNVLVDTFPSHTAAAEYLGVTRPAVSKLVDTGRRNLKGFIYYSTPLSS